MLILDNLDQWSKSLVIYNSFFDRFVVLGNIPGNTIKIVKKACDQSSPNLHIGEFITNNCKKTFEPLLRSLFLPTLKQAMLLAVSCLKKFNEKKDKCFSQKLISN